MTETVSDTGRRTQVVDVGGTPIVIRELRDLQLVHIMRYSRVLSSNSVATDDKLNAIQRMMEILHSIVVQPTDLEFLIAAEERGEVSIEDMLGFVRAFQDDAPTKPAVRRGPRAKR
jgi:hypothetical protein